MSMKITPIKIDSEEAYEEAVATPEKLILIDIHSGWCHACVSMMGTYEACVMNFDDFNDRVHIYWANADKIESLKEYAGTSQPRFKLFKGGEELAMVVGANAPEILELITQHIPAKSEE